MDLELRKVWEDTGATVLGGGGTERGQRGGAVTGAQAQSVTGSRRLLAPVPTGTSVLRDLEVSWGSFQTPRTSYSQVPCRSTLLPPAVTSLGAQMLPSLQGLVAPSRCSCPSQAPLSYTANRPQLVSKEKEVAGGMQEGKWGARSWRWGWHEEQPS